MAQSKFLQEEANVDVYLADHMSNKKYPYRIQPPGECNSVTVAQSEKNILDSGINNNTTTKDVLEEANRVDAELVVPCDVIGEHEKSKEKTFEMLNQVEDTDISIIVPVQAQNKDNRYDNAVDMINSIEDAGYEDSVRMYGVGGVKEKESKEQVRISKTVRNAIGDTHIHLFGAGFSPAIIWHIRDERQAFDSLDNATAVRFANNNRFMTCAFEKIRTPRPGGKHSSYVTARQAESILTNMNYLLSDGPREEELIDVIGEEYRNI